MTRNRAVAAALALVVAAVGAYVNLRTWTIEEPQAEAYPAYLNAGLGTASASDAGDAGDSGPACVDTAPPCGGYLSDAGASVILYYSENFNCGLSAGAHVWQSLTVATVSPNNAFTDDAGLLHLVVSDGGAGAYNVGAIVDTAFSHQYGRWAVRWKAPPVSTNNWMTADTYGINCQTVLGTNTPGCTAGGGGWQPGSLELTPIETYNLSNATVDQEGHSYISNPFGDNLTISSDSTLTAFHIAEVRWANGPGGVNDAGNGVSFWMDGQNTFGPSGYGYGNGQNLIDGSIGPYSPGNYHEPVGWTLDNNANNHGPASTYGTGYIDWLCVYALADGGT